MASSTYVYVHMYIIIIIYIYMHQLQYFVIWHTYERIRKLNTLEIAIAFNSIIFQIVSHIYNLKHKASQSVPFLKKKEQSGSHKMFKYAFKNTTTPLN